MKLGDVAAALGKGIFAGVAGTAAMTASSTIEMKLRGRPASSAPARAAARVLGAEPVNEESEARFSNIVHWGYGTAWGGVRGLIGAAGLSGPAATAAHLGAIWGSEQVMLPTLGVAPPLTEWGAKGWVLAVSGTNDLDEITQQRLIEISDEHAVRTGDSVEDWGSCDPHPLVRRRVRPGADTVNAVVTLR